ncbi:MAG: RNA-guided pseudouridylation complex pseudouridine synthase subunit Cbf5 [Candidatus Kariarchaeaceae archaeon]
MDPLTDPSSSPFFSTYYYSGQLIQLKESETDTNQGIYPHERSIQERISYGMINLDKPRNPTSHEVVAWLKLIFNIPKAGHSGTLDPAVSGVLPVGLLNSTKILKTLLIARKEYVFNLQLHSEISFENLHEISLLFEGEIYQRPPLRSNVRKVLRTRKIYDLTLYELKESNALYKVSCEAGTYVRTLCVDIGEASGAGAHMKELRRTKSGPFSEDDPQFSTLQQINDAYTYWTEDEDESYLNDILIPIEEGVSHLPHIIVSDGAVRPLCHGINLAIPGITHLSPNIEPNQTVAIKSLKGELVGIGKSLLSSKQMQGKTKGHAVKMSRIVMPRETYHR